MPGSVEVDDGDFAFLPVVVDVTHALFAMVGAPAGPMLQQRDDEKGGAGSRRAPVSRPVFIASYPSRVGSSREAGRLLPFARR